MSIKIKHLLIIIVIVGVYFGYTKYHSPKQGEITINDLMEEGKRNVDVLKYGTTTTVKLQNAITEDETATFKSHLDIVNVPADDQEFIRKNPNKRVEISFAVYVPQKTFEGFSLYRPSVNNVFQYNRYYFHLMLKTDNGNTILVDQYSWPDIKKEVGDLNKARSIMRNGKKVWIPDGNTITSPRFRYVQGAKIVEGSTYISISYTGDYQLGDSDLAEFATSFIK